MGMGSVADISP